MFQDQAVKGSNAEEKRGEGMEIRGRGEGSEIRGKRLTDSVRSVEHTKEEDMKSNLPTQSNGTEREGDTKSLHT